eukprot:4259404-Karenia_brevis.AAC.1
MPIKGPWFTDLKQLEEYLSSAHPATGNCWSLRVVQVRVTANSAGKDKDLLHKVMTNAIGFVNDYHNLSQRPNAQLVWDPDRGLGEHTLRLKITQT